MRPTPLAFALASLAACASSRTPAPAAPHADPDPATTPTVAPETAPSPEAVAPRPGAGTFGPGVWEPDFRHAGDTRRYRSYLFFEDGRFERRVGGYDHLPSVACNLREAVASGGTWRREGDDVVLRTAWEDHVRGGRRAESPVRGCTDEGGSFARTELHAPREERVAVGVCAAFVAAWLTGKVTATLPLENQVQVDGRTRVAVPASTSGTAASGSRSRTAGVSSSVLSRYPSRRMAADSSSAPTPRRPRPS